MEDRRTIAMIIDSIAHLEDYKAVLPYLEERKLDPWTHGKAIQKALESRRLTPEQKDHLRGLK